MEKKVYLYQKWNGGKGGIGYVGFIKIHHDIMKNIIILKE
jgi:hypothetical protein